MVMYNWRAPSNHPFINLGFLQPGTLQIGYLYGGIVILVDVGFGGSLNKLCGDTEVSVQLPALEFSLETCVSGWGTLLHLLEAYCGLGWVFIGLGAGWVADTL